MTTDKILILQSRPKTLRLCPRGCTQKRNRRNRLTERKTFDGRRCSNCYYTIEQKSRPSYQKYSLMTGSKLQ